MRRSNLIQSLIRLPGFHPHLGKGRSGFVAAEWGDRYPVGDTDVIGEEVLQEIRMGSAKYEFMCT